MRSFLDPLSTGGAPLRRLLLGVTAAGALAGCAQVLGLDPLSEGSDPDGGGDIDARGAVDAQPQADAMPTYAPFACDWKPGSIRLINSLADQPPPGNQYDNEILMAPAERNVRVFLQHRTAVESVVEVWSIGSEDGQVTGSFPGFCVSGARRMGTNRVGALVSVPSDDDTESRQLAMASVLDGDQSSDAVKLDVLSPALPVPNLEADFLTVGLGATWQGDLITVTSYRPEAALPYRAELLYYDGFATQPSLFDEDQANTLRDADYDIVAMLRDDQDRNHVFLGSRFDGAMGTRHFILDDQVSGEVEPVRLIDDLLVGIQQRPDGTFLAAYAEIDDTSGTLSLRIGEISGSELTTHEAGDLPVSDPIGTVADIPSEGLPFLTRDHFIAIGKRGPAATEEIAVIIAHRTGQLRANQGLAFPAAAPVPAQARIKRISAVVPDPFIFDSAGGDIVVVWTFEVGDQPHDELFYGEIQCVPSSSTTAQP